MADIRHSQTLTATEASCRFAGSLILGLMSEFASQEAFNHEVSTYVSGSILLLYPVPSSGLEMSVTLMTKESR